MNMYRMSIHSPGSQTHGTYNTFERAVQALNEHVEHEQLVLVSVDHTDPENLYSAMYMDDVAFFGAEIRCDHYASVGAQFRQVL